MSYLRCFFSNFLIIFFVNYFLPGIELGEHKLPHVGTDFIFACLLALLNSLIYPVLRVVQRHSISLIKISFIALVLNFLGYIVLKFFPLGIEVLTVESFFIAAVIASIGSVVASYLWWKKNSPKVPKHPTEPPKAP